MPELRMIWRLFWLKLHAHSYIEYTDTGTAAYFIEYGTDRIRMG